MDILVLALILICAVAGVHFLLNDKPKAAAFSLLPIPALAILSNQLGISGLYPFIAFVCVCVMFFEFLLVRQLNAGKRVFPVFLLLAVGFVDSIDGWGLNVGIATAVIFCVGAEGNVVPTCARGEQFLLFAIEIDNIEVAVKCVGLIG